VDIRQYRYVKPVSFAFRVYHYARYGSDAETNRISPLFVGFPTLVRGYENVRFGDQQNLNQGGFTINDLLGSRLLVSNFEIRLPFTGPERFSVLKSKAFFTELSLFFDGGIAWDSQTNFFFDGDGISLDAEATPVFSTGVSFRINLFGQIILEPYYAIPFQRNDITGGVFGLNFWPGW